MLYGYILFFVLGFANGCVCQDYSIKLLIQKYGQPKVEWNAQQNTEINLAGKALTSLDGLENITHKEIVNVFLLSHNAIEVLPGSDLPNKSPFKDYPNLQDLQISHNELKQVRSCTLKHAFKLKRLSFSHNKITHVYPEAFLSLKNLVDLNLSHNQLTELVPMVLKGLPNLKVLDVSDNKLTKIPKVQNLFALEMLLLARNKITHIHQDDLKELHFLKIVDLKDNPLKTIDSRFINEESDLTSLEIGDVMVKITGTPKQLRMLARILK